MVMPPAPNVVLRVRAVTYGPVLAEGCRLLHGPAAESASATAWGTPRTTGRSWRKHVFAVLTVENITVKSDRGLSTTKFLVQIGPMLRKLCGTRPRVS